MASPLNYPDLPEGFVLDEKISPTVPELPEGFVLDKPSAAPFEGFEEITEEVPPFKEELGRHAARTASRIVESVGGLPGDVGRLLQTGAEALGTQAAKVREKIGLKPLKERKAPPGIPGSKELRDLSVKLFGKKVLPISKKESFIDDIVSDAAVLAIPVKGKIPFMRSIGTALTGNLGVKGAEALGFEEKGKGIAKLGAFFLSGMLGRGNVKKYWNQQYRLAEKAIPKNIKVNTFKLERKLDNVSREIGKGISTPSKTFVKTPLNDIRKKIKTGRVNVDELVQFKKDINELRGKLYKDLTGKQSIKYAQGKINDLSALIDSEISAYGKQNPTFLQHYKNANQAYAGFAQSKRVGNWINRHLKGFGKPAILILEGLFPKLLPASAITFVGLKSGELLTRVMRNPTLRRFYANLMKDAVKENIGGFVKNLRAMEKEIKKSDPDIFD